MVNIEGEVVINRPVDEVFNFVADERNDARYTPGTARLVQQAPPGKMDRGTRYRGESSWMGLTVETTSEITGYEPPRFLSLTSRSSLRLVRRITIVDGQVTLALEPVLEGTRLQWFWELIPRGLFKLITPRVRRIGRKQSETIYGNLKRVLEAETARGDEAS